MVFIYKLVVADDESQILMGLSQGINWNDLGFELCGSFNDGEEILEYIKLHKVDVILTDICMSFVSGLEVAKYIYENHIETITVLISGYQEFRLAREAIKYSVDNYLLKPIDISEIKTIFTNIKNKLDKTCAHAHEKLSEQKEYFELLKYSRAQWLQELYFGINTEYEYIKNQCLRLFKIYNPDKFICFIIDMIIPEYANYLKTKWKYGAEALNAAIINIIEKQNNIEFHHVSGKAEHEVSICVLLEESLSIEDLNLHLQSCSQNLMEILKLNVEFRVLASYSSPFELAENRRTFLFSETKQSFDDTSLGQIEELKKLILSNISTLQLNSVQKLFDSLLTRLSNSPMWIQQCYIIETLSSILYKFSENGEIKPPEKVGFFNRIMSAKQPSELKNSVYGIIENISSYVVLSQDEQEDDLIKKAKKYIDQNYHKDISLDILSEELFITKTYLCRLFKEKSGYNFVDYLTNVRISKAIELMSQNQVKIYMVGELVGYNDARYFARLFKNKIGMSPSEYLKTLSPAGVENEL